MAQKYGFVYLKFTFQPIAWKHLNSSTTIDTLRKLGSAEVTHPFSVREVLSSIPSSSKGLYVLFFCFVVLLLFVQNTLSQNVAVLSNVNLFSILNILQYL